MPEEIKYLRQASSIGSMLIAFACIVSFAGCGRQSTANSIPSRPDELFRVGSIIVYQKDLDQKLAEKFGGRADDKSRAEALKLLVRRARFAQAALDAGLDEDPLVRGQVSRLLEARLRETELDPKIKQSLEIPDRRLREIYQEKQDSFVTSEKRQVAVLWLNSAGNPDKEYQYAQKMTEACQFALQDADLCKHPEKGFSILGADYSEHHASRFKGGLIGWLDGDAGFNPWIKVVADIAFKLPEVGAVSEVTIGPQGVFLVRLTNLQAAVNRSFDSARAELRRAEQTRLREQLTERFEQEVIGRHPVIWSTQ